MTKFQPAIDQFISYGFGYVEIDQELLTSAVSATTLLIQAKKDTGESFCFSSNSIGSHEVGIITSDRLCYTYELLFQTAEANLRENPHTIECLRAVERYYRHLKEVAVKFCAALNQHSALDDLAGRVRPSFDSAKLAPPTCLTIYPNCIGWEPQQDPGLLSFLYTAEAVRIRDATGAMQLATPPVGTMLVLGGKKIELLDHPKLKPVEYSINNTHAVLVTLIVDLNTTIKAVEELPDNVESLFKA